MDTFSSSLPLSVCLLHLCVRSVSHTQTHTSCHSAVVELHSYVSSQDAEASLAGLVQIEKAEMQTVTAVIWWGDKLPTAAAAPAGGEGVIEGRRRS